MVMMGHKRGTPMHPIRRFLIKKNGQIAARLAMLMSGIFHIKVERPDIDYSKYLGPDWKKSYEGESTIIVNHSSWIVNFPF